MYLGSCFLQNYSLKLPRTNCGFHGALSPAQAILIHPKSWSVHTTKLSQLARSTEFHSSILWKAGLLPSFLYNKRSNSCVQLNFSAIFLVDQFPPWSNQLQFSWMKAKSSFASLHNYCLQPYQILCLFLNLHRTKQKKMSCPGAVQKPWLREIADTKNDGHTHRIKSRIWPPIG